ncbi:MAG: hypothetical protein A2008_13195 [Candidatus Wallbacteria bacterium GWC2_49_35]|uniref:G5 domain-containing protein n=1 Tax=Candidatus Wallbacteria bacterium GWC2_49_35 TaxID=1817813 RepID=A0A1F7WKJ6_9BACT|nr:MAG: hypothetical protein A2008_13195 [Candidatus Wallbacteria bacterium GWC2_49_35]HBC74376.1 hypothetical protein [Candidatus Wallbacteria bacterium]
MIKVNKNGFDDEDELYNSGGGNNGRETSPSGGAGPGPGEGGDDPAGEGYAVTGGVRHYETAEDAGEEHEDHESAFKKTFVYLSYAIILATLVALCFFLYQVKVVLDDPCVPNNVFFLNENLGGTNYKSLDRVVIAIADKIGRRPIYLSAAGTDFVISPARDIDFKIDTGMICDQALKVGNQGNLFQRVKYKIRLKTGRMKVSLPCRYFFNRTKLETKCALIAERLNSSPKSATIVELGNGYKRIERDAPGVRVSPEDIYRQIKNELSELASSNFAAIAVEHEQIRPAVSLADKLSQLNSTELISRFETSYITDNPSASINAENAAAALDGLILKPLEVFSFNKFMGAVKYKNERDAAIFNSNRLGFFPDVSGGIGVFASALYNAVLTTRAEVLERFNHTNYDEKHAYCQPGRDAQVIFGSKDLKFMLSKNSAPLIILSEAQKGSLRFLVYGRKPAGETVVIETAEVNVSAPAEKRLKDYSMRKGEEKVEQEGLPGYEVKTVKIVSVNGEQNYRSVISTDIYASVPRVIRVGDSSDE